MSKLYDDFVYMCEVLKNPAVDMSRFDRLLEAEGDSVFDGVTLQSSKLSSIKRFYETTNPFNRAKIVELINNSIDNFDKVHKIVIDYNEAKGQ